MQKERQREWDTETDRQRHTETERQRYGARQGHSERENRDGTSSETPM